MSLSTTISQQHARVVTGQSSSVAALHTAHALVQDPFGEGERAFIGGVSAAAWQQAEEVDHLLSRGIAGPLCGVPLAVKDVFDVAGEVTRAGARVLPDTPAAQDSPVVARLRAAGALLVGRTNMSEFAYTGVGLNPHYGTPRNPFDRQAGRIPGGSSSGAAVAVADGMVVAAVGTDTGGSCRIPAALCGLVGFKPTPGLIPTQGMVPLSVSYDSVGTLARSVQCCAVLDQVMRGVPVSPVARASVAGLHIGLPTAGLVDGMDDEVGDRYEFFKRALREAGAHLVPVTLESFLRLQDLMAGGGIVAAEAHAWHEPWMRMRSARYDPRVLTRIRSGAGVDAGALAALLRRRTELAALYDQEASRFDVLLMPTVPIVAPTIDSLDDDAEFHRVNRLLLRNTSPANVFACGAISVPVGAPGRAPVGMMLMGRTGADERLLSIAEAIFPTH